MSDLSLEQCKNLAGWGLPQRVGRGSWVYWISTGHRRLCGSEDMLSIDFERVGIDWVLDPTLAELMEFAKTLSISWLVKPSPDGWRVTKAAEGVCKLSSWTDASLFDVVYKLIERLQ